MKDKHINREAIRNLKPPPRIVLAPGEVVRDHEMALRDRLIVRWPNGQLIALHDQRVQGWGHGYG